jgi:hypothetical protein
MCDNGICRFRVSHRPAPSHSQSYLIRDARCMCSTERWRLCSSRQGFHKCYCDSLITSITSRREGITILIGLTMSTYPGKL